MFQFSKSSTMSVLDQKRATDTGFWLEQKLETYLEHVETYRKLVEHYRNLP